MVSYVGIMYNPLAIQPLSSKIAYKWSRKLKIWCAIRRDCARDIRKSHLREIKLHERDKSLSDSS